LKFKATALPDEKGAGCQTGRQAVVKDIILLWPCFQVLPIDRLDQSIFQILAPTNLTNHRRNGPKTGCSLIMIGINELASPGRILFLFLRLPADRNSA
jgi:hypothetical protein